MLRVLFLGAAFACAMTPVHAAPDPGLRFGYYRVQSQVGEPLKLVVEVYPLPGEQVSIPCVHMTDSAGTKHPPLDFAIDRPDQGPSHIYLLGTAPVQIGTVHLTLEVGCITPVEVEFDVRVPPETYAHRALHAAAGLSAPRRSTHARSKAEKAVP